MLVGLGSGGGGQREGNGCSTRYCRGRSLAAGAGGEGVIEKVELLESSLKMRRKLRRDGLGKRGRDGREQKHGE